MSHSTLLMPTEIISLAIVRVMVVVVIVVGLDHFIMNRKD